MLELVNMGIRGLGKPECDPSGGSSAKSLPTSVATEQQLGFQQLFPLAQTSFKIQLPTSS